MADDRLDLHLHRRAFVERARRGMPRLTGNLRQLGAVGPVVRTVPAHSQRVLVRVNITQASTTRAHLRYLQHAKGMHRQDAALFGPGAQDPQAFAQAAQHDPRQFRLIVSPESAAVEDRTAFIERFMAQVQQDLGRPLSWVAAHHSDTAHPHTHIVVRGVDTQGQDWLMAKHYKTHGIEQRARQLLTWMLGPLEHAQSLDLGQAHAVQSRASGLSY